MPNAWMPGATRHHRTDDGGAMAGGPPRVVWHTTEGGTTARQYKTMRYPSHLVWQPNTGEIVQLIPADRAGRALENDVGGAETNRMGRCCIQIEVVGRAASPFTSGPMKGLDEILDWLDSWDIPRVFPSGRPGGNEMYGPNRQRSVTTWRTKAGHFGHSQVPENVHWDPGHIDIDRLLGDDMPLSADDVKRIADAVWERDAIPAPETSSTKKTNPTWAAQNVLRGAYDRAAEAKALAAQLAGRGTPDVDEAEVARLVLAGLTPESIAAAIPDSVARDVVDELARRLGTQT